MGGPGPADERGFAALDPEDARRFAGRVDDLERTVAEAREALRRLAEDPLATGTGQENAEMASWYRELLVTDTVPGRRGPHAPARRGAARGRRGHRGVGGGGPDDLRFGRSRPVIPPFE